jgi:hypothetical protein
VCKAKRTVSSLFVMVINDGFCQDRLGVLSNKSRT